MLTAKYITTTTTTRNLHLHLVKYLQEGRNDAVPQNKIFQKDNSCKNEGTHGVELFVLTVNHIWKLRILNGTHVANVKIGITKNVNKFLKVYLIKATRSRQL